MRKLLIQRSNTMNERTLINIFPVSFSQTIEMIKNGVRLSPPPGCPRAIYELMIQCW